jgi:protein-disulfide isomerase/uncharacterized membrane protein
MRNVNESDGRGETDSIRWPQLILILLPIIGATLSVILIDIHVQNQLGGLFEGTLCGPSDACNTLAVSRFSAFIGVPLAFWGLAFYLAVLGLGIALRNSECAQRWFLQILRNLVGAALLIDGILLYIMLGVEQVFCPLCAATYLVNVALLLSILWARRSVIPGSINPGTLDNAVILAVAVLSTLTLVFGLALSHYLEIAQNRRVAVYLSKLSDPVKLTFPKDRTQGFGNPNGPLKMVIFHDFRCLHCSHLRRKARILAKQLPGKLFVQFVNFPFDKACNSQAKTKNGACDLARAAIAAESKSKLVDYLERLGQKPPKSLKELTGILKSIGVEEAELAAPTVQRRLESDIRLGQKLKIRSLPTFFINGYRFEGVPGIRGLRAIFRRIEAQGS